MPNERRGLLDSPKETVKEAPVPAPAPEKPADWGSPAEPSDLDSLDLTPQEPNRRHGMTEETAKFFRGKRKRAKQYAKEIHRTPPDLDFKWPLAAVEVTSPFGKRGRSFHEGVDLKARVGTPVHAAQAGRVIYAGAKIRGYGRMIVLKHAGKLATIYAHNSRLLVRRGEFVRQGQAIAMTGNTGHSTGPHLHFEIRRELTLLNPVQVLPAARGASYAAMDRIAQ